MYIKSGSQVFFLLISLSVVVVQSNPVRLNFSLKYDTHHRPLRFFWYPTLDNQVPAFLEGGPSPNAKAAEHQIKFYLYTLENPTTPEEIEIGKEETILSSYFVRGAPLKLVAHGFSSNYLEGPAPAMKNAYFKANLTCNFIAIDWKPLAAAPWYDTAAAATKIVGDRTALLVLYLHSLGHVQLEDVHFSGHSLGAHIGGFMGKAIGTGRVGRITGLDPALPLFGDVDDSKRLAPSDAAFVDVIHTAGGTMLHGGLAFISPRGHADFYPNGGEDQPGCGYDAFGSCSHCRSYLYMAESILSAPGKFPCCSCSSWDKYLNGNCQCQTFAVMGEYASRNARGSFFLRTGSRYPYSLSF
ncbi:unnamed protein product [Allacma fusca]|uniref:Lipase domain-containing protein n=1 Tax=Allacma fusca TaxID=39272 RepID=A0A8J2KMY1_9HEXA|nr:unnamed protein product [Allacma fusca]